MKKWLSILVMALALVSFGSAQVTPITKTATVAVTVATAPDFTLTTATPTINTYPNRTIPVVADLTSVNTFTGEVTVTLSGIPTGWNVTTSPATGKVTISATAPKSVTFTIVIPANATVGTTTLTLTATSTNYN